MSSITQHALMGVVSHITMSYNSWKQMQYGVATITRLLKITSLFCKRTLQKRPIVCK